MSEEKDSFQIVNSHNEWDPLEEIIIGTALNARIPSQDKSFKALSDNAHDLLFSDIEGDFPKKIIDETEEDISILINELTKLDIIVRRPSQLKMDNFKTPDWSSDSFYPYCPRDVITVIGETLIETPNVFRSRYFETFAYRDLFVEYMKQGARWISAPKPRLQDTLYEKQESQTLAIANHEPVFDAANIVRAGRDIFYLVSDSGNELGAQWLQSALGHNYQVHPCQDLYSSVHIDTTLVLLRPGLLLANPERVNEDNLPDPLKKWDILYAPDMIEYQYSELKPISSPWLGMNLLMLSESLAVVDSFQTPLIKLLEDKGIDVLPFTLRHGRTLGGGAHCITLDVRRKGELENYF